MIDDGRPEKECKKLQKSEMGKTIPWYYAKETKTGAKELSDFYFVQNLFDIHPLSDLYTIFLDKLITKIKMFALKRAKLNCYHWSENLIKHKFNIDYQVKQKALILYFNTWNGFTMCKDNNKIE